MSMFRLRKGTNDVEAQAGAYNALLTLGGPKYMDLVRRGIVWMGGTDSAGVAPGTALSTGAGFVLENPSDSPVYLVVLKATVGFISGILGGGEIVWVTDAGAALATPIVTSTTITVYNALIRSGGSPRGQLHDAATLLNTPTILRPAFAMSDIDVTGGVAAVQGPFAHIEDPVDGEFILPPGAVLALEGIAAAGTTPLVGYGIVWAEIAPGELPLP